VGVLAHSKLQPDHDCRPAFDDMVEVRDAEEARRAPVERRTVPKLWCQPEAGTSFDTTQPNVRQSARNMVLA